MKWIDLPSDPDVLDGSKTPPSRQEERYHKFFDSQPALDLSRAHAAGEVTHSPSGEQRLMSCLPAHGRLYSSLAELSLVSSRSSTSSTSLYDMARPTDTVDCLTVDQEVRIFKASFGNLVP